MTAKNRHKSSGTDKNSAAPAPGQEDAAKRNQRRPSSGDGPAAAGTGAAGAGAQRPRSRSCLGLLVNTLFYVVLLGAAAFSAFYLQQVVEETRQSSGKLQERVLQQVESLRRTVDGLESSLGVTRAELEEAVGRVKMGDVQTKRVEEALQNLQNDLLGDLSEGIKEVKEARESDFSSLEKIVEERLAEVSQSIAANMAEFTEAQGEAQSQLADLKARLGDVEDPALVKEELAAIVNAVAEIKSAKQEADTSVDSLREQIGAVRGELQTRNLEVTSLSQEVETVRSVVQETVGSLRQSLSAAEAGLQALKDRTVAAESGVDQVAEAVRNVERQVSEAAAQAQRRSEDLEARVKASEDSRDALSASVSEMASKVESLLAKHDTHESALAAHGQAVEKAKTSLEQELETLRSSLQEIQSSMSALDSAQAQLASEDTSLGRQIEGLETRLAAVEVSSSSSSSSVRQEQLENLQSIVAGLETKAAKLEGHDQAIASLQKALQETTQTLAGLSGAADQK